MVRKSTPKARTDRLRYARIAGAAYLTIVLAAFVHGGLMESQLVVPGDDMLTAANILAHPLQFRLGIVLVFTIYASVVVASWALFLVLRDVHESVAFPLVPGRIQASVHP